MKLKTENCFVVLVVFNWLVKCQMDIFAETCFSSCSQNLKGFHYQPVDLKLHKSPCKSSHSIPAQPVRLLTFVIVDLFVVFVVMVVVVGVAGVVVVLVLVVVS